MWDPSVALRRYGGPDCQRGYSQCVLELGAALVAIVLLSVGLRLIVLWANDVQVWKEQERDQADWP